MNRSTILSMVAAAGVALIIGLAAGLIAFPATRNLTTTAPASTATITQSASTVTTTFAIAINNSVTRTSHELVTITVQTLLVDVVLPTCTTISGTPTVVYGYPGFGGETTTVTTVFPTGLPSEFNATVVTASTVAPSNHTQYFTGSCG